MYKTIDMCLRYGYQSGITLLFKLPNEKEAIFWFGVAWWFSFEKVLSFVGAFTQGVTLDMVGIFPHVFEHKI
jgi:hypothetical protein